MESERVDQVLSATTPEALQEAVDELHPALNQEEVATVLRKTALPEARTIADLAGRRGIAPLLENPAFEARRVVRAWLDLLTQPQQGDLSISLASALARLASAGMLEADELREIQGILLSRDVKLVAARDALAFHVVQLPLTAAQLRQFVRRRRAALNETVARGVAIHRNATSAVWHELLGTGYMNLMALAGSRGARTDPVVRSRLLEASADPEIRVALCREASGDEFRELWAGLLAMDMKYAVSVLKNATAAQRRTLTRELLLPLLESEERDHRITAIGTLADAGTRSEGRADLRVSMSRN